MTDGRSPDSRYAVRIFRVKNADPSDYAVRLCSTAKTKPLFSFPDIGGYLHYPAAVERDHALWHASSQFVAITDQDTRHSTELYVLALFQGRVERLQLPDYVQNALGRVNTTEVDFACVSKLKHWDGDDLVLDLYFTANQRRSYTCEVVLHVSHGKNNFPSIGLKSVSAPTEQDG